MGRIFVELDPEGYKSVEEPGAHFEWRGDQFLKIQESWNSTTGGVETTKKRSTGFYNPPGSEFVMLRPRQFDPTWIANADLGDFVLTESHWTFASGVTHTQAEWWSKAPDGRSYADNLGVWCVCGNSIDSVNECDYAEMGEAAGIVMPSGMKSVAMTQGTTPIAQPLIGMPYLQWASFPPPDDILVFGFFEFALILSLDRAVLLRSPDAELHTWELLAKFGKAEKVDHTGSIFSSSSGRMDMRSVLLYDVGEWLYAHWGQGEVGRARFRERGNVGGQRGYTAIRPGNWWFGAAPKQKFAFQVQVVAYSSFSTQTLSTPLTGAIFFDLTTGYKPTLAPSLKIDPYGHADPENPLPPVELVDAQGTSLTYQSGEVITYGLRDPAYDPWVTDGTKYYGTIHLELEPGWSGLTTPWVKWFQLRWPVKLRDRVANPLMLEDTQFHSVHAEANYREPAGKRVEVRVTDAQVGTLVDAGFDVRTDYPIHILEDTDDDDVGDTLRIAGWVKDPDLSLLKADPSNDFLVYELHARGLLEARAGTKWLYLPQVVDSDNPGFLDHLYVVEEVLKSKGFDVEDADRVFLAEDEAEEVYRRLPATAGTGASTAISEKTLPKWDETALEYLQRVPVKWRGWILYERLDGKVFYHPDLGIAVDVQMGFKYYRSGTLYRTQALAAAASLPAQYYLANPTRTIVPPEGNAVRVSGTDQEGKLIPHLIRRNETSLDDPEDVDYGIGDYKVISLQSDLALNTQDVDAIDRVAFLELITRSRRKIYWPVVVPLPPWEWEDQDGELGTVWEFQSRGDEDHLAVHVEVELLKSADTSIWRTRMTGEKLPVGASRNETTPGDYPGAGSMEA